ncbi:MutH/Sau3AI family endonuclease [Spiroplasma clarkii]|uniref:DNA mismatch repair protein MutH n=1 Tax=Spiroplasma clarkii TaxID=2139 RepID=A0A2K8KHQ6_9MOLU|nr:MutH/Sau3AI family endonuclease [Spiroplasma clarkii]ATX71223.1 DNA mismatch repair protein MutH [Spiroplasma clarkii]
MKEIYDLAKSAIGKSIREIIGDNVDELIINDKNKGTVGNLIQKYLFKIEPNNISEADFKELGLDLELKVIPLLERSLKNKLAPKERMVLGMINYHKIVDETFEESSFLKKNRHLLIMTYLYDYNADKLDYKIIDAFLYDVTADDFFPDIKSDWEKINKAVVSGEAHLLTEKNNNILSPSTKGGSENNRKQPNSDEIAKGRAYSYKVSFVKKIIENFAQEEFDFFIKNLNKINYIEKEDIEAEIYDFLNSLIGTKIPKGDKIEKNWHENVFKKTVREKDEKMFQKMYKNPYLKFSHKVLDEKGNLQEEINTNVDILPLEIINEEFENSSLFNNVIDKKYVIIGIDKKTNIFKKYWTFTFNDSQIEKCKIAFEKVKERIQNYFNSKSDEKFTFNLKKSDDLAIHLRPHAKNGSKTYEKKGVPLDIVIHEWWINKKEIT